MDEFLEKFMVCDKKCSNVKRVYKTWSVCVKNDEWTAHNIDVFINLFICHQLSTSAISYKTENWKANKKYWLEINLLYKDKTNANVMRD